MNCSYMHNKLTVKYNFIDLVLIFTVSGFLTEENIVGKCREEKLWLELEWVIARVEGKTRNAVDTEL